MNTHYRRVVRRYRITLWSVVSILCVGGLSLGVFTDYTFLAAGVCGIGFFAAIVLACDYCSKPFCSVHPYFKKSLHAPNQVASTFFRGQELAKHLDAIDAILEESGSPTVSSFGYEDSWSNAQSNWYSAADGLLVFRTLLELSEDNSDLDGAIREVQAIIEALEIAEAKSVDFCLHIRCHNSISPQEFGVREGYYH